MKTTLIFPSYMHLAGFMSVADNGDIDMDLRTKSLSADFSDKDLQTALQGFGALVQPVTVAGVNLLNTKSSPLPGDVM